MTGRPDEVARQGAHNHADCGSQRKRRTATTAPTTPHAAITARCRQSAPACLTSSGVLDSLTARPSLRVRLGDCNFMPLSLSYQLPGQHHGP
jgi:hypothetical protein